MRRFATTPLQRTTTKPYYVTTPIFYVNAGSFYFLAPELGLGG